MAAALMVALFIVVMQTTVLFHLQRQHQKERSQLLNRIMARDYQEYVVTERKTIPKAPENYYKKHVEKAVQQQEET
jgi:hypothetical protein